MILGGVAGDIITAAGGSENIILGDNGVVTLTTRTAANSIYSTDFAIGGDDTIKAGTDNANATSNVIIGGYGDDHDHARLRLRGRPRRQRPGRPRAPAIVGFGTLADLSDVYTARRATAADANDTIVSNGGDERDPRRRRLRHITATAAARTSSSATTAS